ncbi:MAG: hypothetical protein WCT03_14785 [Candidatus Obscuribacterales bacterium]
MLEWQKFRYVVNSAANTSIMKWKATASPSNDVQEALLEIGKSHHEAISSLVFLRMCLDDTNEVDALSLKRNVKQFYFHAGCLLDNLSRLIFIICDPDSPTKDHRSAKTATGKKIRVRRFIDWGSLKSYDRSQPHYSAYSKDIRSKTTTEIVNVRNSLTHSWQPIFNDQKIEGRVAWPKAVRYKRDFYWGLDITEAKYVRKEYKGWLAVKDMMSKDFAYLEKLQARTFKQLSSDVLTFESRFDFEII